MENLIIPEGYKSSYDVLETQIIIKEIKDYFERSLAKHLNLTRVSAPLYVRSDSGINDYLTGVEKPVNFKFNDGDDIAQLEIVQSLAKWKRIALKRYGFEIGSGIYTDMDAIRPHETLGNKHSLYVDQWDWEKVISNDNRNIEYLKETVRNIYKAFIDTQNMMRKRFSSYNKILPDEIFFITAEELARRYPKDNPETREYKIAKEKKAVFIIGIGHKLSNGEPHDIRSPDYDDWNLNGDIILWNPVLNSHLELSSMGIRVNKNVLLEQLKLSDTEDRLELEYHQMILNNELPLTIGGGIGQSRICMFFLQKAHIGEVQASIWPEEMVEICKKNGIHLL